MLLAVGCEKKPTGTITLPPDAKKLAVENSAFAFDLYQQLRSSESAWGRLTAGNLFFSPYSISTALVMTYAGARGNTEKQMAKTLRFSLDQENLPPACARLQTWMNQLQESGGIRLHVANSLWPQEGYKFLDEYLSLVKKHYGASITPIDYEHAICLSLPRFAKRTWM
jgi:serpin B